MATNIYCEAYHEDCDKDRYHGELTSMVAVSGHFLLLFLSLFSTVAKCCVCVGTKWCAVNTFILTV